MEQPEEYISQGSRFKAMNEWGGGECEEPTNKLGIVVYVCPPRYPQGVNMRILIQIITKAKMGWGVAQVVEQLSGRLKAPNSKCSSDKKKNCNLHQA
jgi:hypothetical protein